MEQSLLCFARGSSIILSIPQYVSKFPFFSVCFSDKVFFFKLFIFFEREDTWIQSP